MSKTQMSAEITSFLRREELARRMLETVFELTRDGKDYTELDDLVLFMRFMGEEGNLHISEDEVISYAKKLPNKNKIMKEEFIKCMKEILKDQVYQMK